jgi:hypothetical protein
MPAKPHFTLSSLPGMTRFAPLVAFGFMCHDHGLWSPISTRLHFPSGMHTEKPENAVLTLWVSIMAGCRSVSQINTTIRPDIALAQAWQQSCFPEQSTVARVLDQLHVEQVEQLRDGVESISAWMGRAAHHSWQEPLLIDIDLTPLPASKHAEGSTKGYFSEKRGAMGDNCAGLGQHNMTKWSAPCSSLAIH